MKKKYFVNPGSGTLHRYNYEKCYNSKLPPPKAKFYDSEDEAISVETRYMKHCKICFKNE